MKEQKISHLEGDAERGLRRIVFDNGSEISREGLFYGRPQRQSSDLAEALGCEIGAMGPFPAVVEGDPTTRETTVPGVYVAGDDAAVLQGAIMAASSGATAASFANHALVTEDIETELAAAPAAQQELGRTS